MTGDRIRLIQVLLNFVKLTFKLQQWNGGQTKILAAYDYNLQQIKVSVLNTNMRSIDKRHVNVLDFIGGKDSMEEGDDEYTGIESIGILICRSIIK